MKKIICSCITHRGLELLTMQSIQAFPFHQVFIEEGIADLSLARCIQISNALKFASQPFLVDDTYILIVDDDIVFTSNDVLKLATSLDKDESKPVSGKYCIGKGGGWGIAADEYLSNYLTGFGFMMLPVKTLLDIQHQIPTFKFKGHEYRAWARGGFTLDINDNYWKGEDYAFCELFDGIKLIDDVEVGHIKKLVIRPNNGQVSVRNV